MLEVIDGRDQSAPVHIPRPRAAGRAADSVDAARAIVEDVRLRGDAAVVAHTARLDGASLRPVDLRVPPEVLERALELVSPELVAALQVLKERLRATCLHQRVEGWFERSDGAATGELVRPLRRAGLYAPGGRAAYPSTVLMMAVPAHEAGVEALALASPPTAAGEIAEPVLAACSVAGIAEVYRMGGAQAIAALAYGTESVRPVDKIFGPGNVFVTEAKRLVSGWVGVDSEAGPTEIAVIADGAADAQLVAADLVAQAEHGPHGTHALVTWDPALADRVLAALELAVVRHRDADAVENALIEGGRVVLVRDARHAFDTINAFAPEHLALHVADARGVLEQVRNAGAVFVGAGSPVSVGDYLAGTNHVLPTGGAARWSSGLSVRDFVKTIYVSELTPRGLARLAPGVQALAEAEGLHAHAHAVEARLEDDR